MVTAYLSANQPKSKVGRQLLIPLQLNPKFFSSLDTVQPPRADNKHSPPPQPNLFLTQTGPCLLHPSPSRAATTSKPGVKPCTVLTHCQYQAHTGAPSPARVQNTQESCSADPGRAVRPRAGKAARPHAGSPPRRKRQAPSTPRR